MKRYTFMLLVGVLALSLVLTSCGSAPTSAPTTSESAPTSAPATSESAPTSAPTGAPEVPLQVLLITGTGGLGDQGFNDAGNVGAQRAVEELGIELDVIEPMEVVEFEPQYRSAASSGEYDLIVGLGFEQAEPANLIAEGYPDQSITVIDSASSQPNVQGVVFREEENAFLAGVLAAYVTQQADLPGANADKVIGIVLGIDAPHVRRYAISYEAGAKTVDPDVSVLVGVVGDFQDQAKAKELSIAQIEQGADIVYQVAGGAGLGVFNAAEGKGVYAIGEGLNQNSLHPEFIIASTYKRMDNAVYDAIQSIAEGTFEGGNFNYGFAEGYLIVDLAGSNVPVSDDAKAALEEYEARLASGELVAPVSQEDLDAYLHELGL